MTLFKGVMAAGSFFIPFHSRPEHNTEMPCRDAGTTPVMDETLVFTLCISRWRGLRTAARTA